MSDKLYPEVDPMAFRERYCDHLLAITAEGLHYKSDIAAQLAWRDDQLAAKDAEIAELRESMAKQAAAVRNLHSAEKVLASGLLREADKLNKQSKPEAIASERDANAALTDALEAAERERDEARECVRRLWRAGSPFQEAVPYFDSRHDAQISTEWQALQSALAATPEHLRSTEPKP